MSAPPSMMDTAQNNEIFTPDDFFNMQLESQIEIKLLINDLINNSVRIARSHELWNEKSKYAAKTISQELLLNATAAEFTLDQELIDINPDDDLELPRPDQWCSGVIPLITPDAINFRTTVLPERNNPHVVVPKPPKKEPQATPEKKESPQRHAVQQQSTNKSQKLSKEFKTPTQSNADNSRSRSMLSQSYMKTNLSPATQILKAFEISKKQTQGSGRNFTIDSENNVIPIHDPKQLANVLIVPRVQTKRPKQEETVSQPRKYKPAAVPVNRLSKKKKAVSRLLQPDQPVFDEEIQDYSATNMVANAGVTIRDGTLVKNVPKPNDTDKITMAQYEEYIHTLKTAQDV